MAKTKVEKMGKLVKGMVKDGLEDTRQITANLIIDGFSPTIVARHINSILAEHGLAKAITRTNAETLETVQAEIADSVKTTEMDTFKDVRLWAEEIAEKHDISSDRAIKAIKQQLREEDKPVPGRVTLGKVKDAICHYFANTPIDETSIKGLQEHLEENVENIEKGKALHHARMNFSFARCLVAGETIDDLN